MSMNFYWISCHKITFLLMNVYVMTFHWMNWQAMNFHPMIFHSMNVYMMNCHSMNSLSTIFHSIYFCYFFKMKEFFAENFLPDSRPRACDQKHQNFIFSFFWEKTKKKKKQFHCLEKKLQGIVWRAVSSYWDN